MRRLPLRRRNAAGFSMIEVLIALVVLAFGLLGLGLLQTMNLRYTKSADQRTKAVNLADELFDMMRSNRSELAGYAMDLDDLTGITVGDGCDTKSALGAASNVERWQCEVREALGPQASVQVEILDAAINDVQITVQWDESHLPELAGQGEIQLRTQL